MIRYVRIALIAVLVVVINVALFWATDGKAATPAKGPKPVVASSNEFELTGNFVRPPLCVYVGVRQPFVFEVQNVGRRPVHALIMPNGLMLGSPYGTQYSFARPSLRGSVPYNLYWPVALMPGQKARMQINLVTPDWVTGMQKGPIQFWFGAEVVVPGSTGSLFVSTRSEFCDLLPTSGK